jgi:protein involved in polysaccharide export with SLBB domain
MADERNPGRNFGGVVVMNWMRGAMMLREEGGTLGVFLLVMGAACALLTGCGDGIRPPSAEQLAAFEGVPPAGPAVDLGRIVEARIPAGPYRVVPGDVLQLEMPRILDPQSLDAATAADARQTCTCRVTDEGAIVLPLVGLFPVAGKSLAQIESGILAQYYPKYVKTPVPVYVHVLEYKTHRVSIVGAVAKPGVYALRHDQMSLVALLMEAGSILDTGAAVIRITRAGPGGTYAPARPGTDLTGAGATPQIPPWMRAVFEQEGPLNTTGWLALEEGNSVLTRKWLDLGNGPQRQAFLRTAAAGLQGMDAERFRDRLLYLAAYLDANPLRNGRPPVAEDAGWQMMERGRFVAALETPGARRGGGGGTPMTTAGPPARTDLALPVRGLNIPFADVALEQGDCVVVEGPQEQFVSVVGLVARPGNMPYPPTARFTLVEAIAFAGGLDLVADPRYVSVYRLKPDGAVASATFRLVNPKNQEQLTQALALPLRPGDVVSVEPTLRTRTNVFFDRFFRISLGLYFSPNDLWNNNND